MTDRLGQSVASRLERSQQQPSCCGSRRATDLGARRMSDLSQLGPSRDMLRALIAQAELDARLLTGRDHEADRFEQAYRLLDLLCASVEQLAKALLSLADTAGMPDSWWQTDTRVKLARDVMGVPEDGRESHAHLWERDRA